MATNENLIPIPGRLHSVASDEIVSGADLIYDDKLLDNLENLNTGFTNDIDTIYNTIGDNNEKGAIMEQLNTIDGRLDTIDGEISALNHIPIEIVQLNPSTGEPNVSNPEGNILYRASNSDQTSYSDWMYKEDDHEWVMIFEQQTPSELEKLVGYYTCNTAANLPEKSVGDTGYVLPANGGAMKIKMTNANTADNATLKIGSETAKPLWYNDERASSSNSWEEGEVISVYYDGSVYQASNALGGGGSKGMKELKGITGAFIIISGDTLGQVVSTGPEAPLYQYIKYPVNEGDVVMVSGKGAAAGRLWGIVGDNDVMIDKSASNLNGNNLVIIMPEGARFIALNSTIASNPKWYYAKKDSVGAHEILTEQFIYGNLRQLNLGENYIINEPVKTSDKQLLKINKEVKELNFSDIIHVGDVRTYEGATYLAQVEVKDFSSTSTSSATVENPVYSIGSPTKLSLTINRGNYNTNFSFTDGIQTVGLEYTMLLGTVTPTTIADTIYTNLNSIENSEWFFTNNGDGSITAEHSGTEGYEGYSFVFSEDSGISCLPIVTITENSTVITLTISLGSGNIKFSFNDIVTNIPVSVNDSEATIASNIISTFVSPENWTFMSDDNVIYATCSDAKDNSTIDFLILENTIGVTGLLTEIWTGSDTISYYDGTNWYIDNGSEYLLNTIFKPIDEYLLIEAVTEKNFMPKIYDDFGNNTDGAISQKFITDYIEKVTETESIVPTFTQEYGVLANLSLGLNFGVTKKLSTKTYGVTGFINVLGYDYIRIWCTTYSSSDNYANVYGSVFYTTNTNAHLYAILENYYTIKKGSARWGEIVLNIPDKAKFIRITSSAAPTYILGKKESVWGNIRNLLNSINPYLLNNLEGFSLGKEYSYGDSVLNDDRNKALVLNKNITHFILNEAIHAGDFRVLGSNTYKCLKGIEDYYSNVAMDNLEYPYSNEDLALGSPDTYSFTISSEESASGFITANINGLSTVSIEITSSINDMIDNIVSQINSVLTNWVSFNAGDNTFKIISKGRNSDEISITFDVGTTGVTVSSSYTPGLLYISLYNSDNKSWSTVNEQVLITNNEYFEITNIDTILEEATELATRYFDINNKNLKTIISDIYNAGRGVLNTFYYTNVNSSNFGKTYLVNGDFRQSAFIDVKGHSILHARIRVSSTSGSYAGDTGALFFDENKVPIRYNAFVVIKTTARLEWKTFEIPSNAAYFVAFQQDNETIQYYFEDIQSSSDGIEEIKEKVENIESAVEKVDELNAKIDPYIKSLKLARYKTDSSSYFGLLHFSDLHGDTIAVDELRKFVSTYGEYFDDVIETGDHVYQYGSHAKNKLNNKTLFVLGNHDSAGNATNAWREGMGDWDYYGKEWCFDTYFSPYLGSWGVGTDTGVKMPEGYNNPDSPNYKACFWHKDYPSNKVRLIGLDCLHRYDGRTDGTRNYLSTNQEVWFKNVLDETLDPNNAAYGYDVIIACHYGLDDYSGAYKKWDETNHKWVYNDILNSTSEGEVISDLSSIMGEGYTGKHYSNSSGGYVMNGNNGRNVNFHALKTRLRQTKNTTNWVKEDTYTSYEWESRFCLRVRGSSPTSGRTALNIFGDILEDWISRGGKFVVWINGHTHVDLMFYPNKYPNILDVTVSRAGTRSDGATNLDRRNDGSNKRMLANLYYLRHYTGSDTSYNYDYNYLVIIRVGYDSDERLVPMELITINYRTGDVIYEK